MEIALQSQNPKIKNLGKMMKITIMPLIKKIK